jgi:tetratricopeptide (TPR) repeat protein
MVRRLLPVPLVFLAVLLLWEPPRLAAQNSHPGSPSSDMAMSISGQVEYPNGEPAGMISVRLESATGSFVKSVSTDGSGSFSFDGLPLGGYDVVIQVAGFQPLRTPVSARLFPVIGLRLTLTANTNARTRPRNLSPTVSVAQLHVPEKAYKALQKGRKLLQAGKPAEAATRLQEAVSIDPDYAWAYMLLAAAYADQRLFPRADDAIHHALRLDRDNPHGYAYFGYVLAKEKKPLKAKQAFEHSIQLLDKDWFAHLELGRLLMEEKHAAAAYPHLVRAHELHPEQAAVHLLLYNDLVLLGRKRKALAELDDFIARFPKNPNVAKIRQTRRQLEKSLEQAADSQSH